MNEYDEIRNWIFKKYDKVIKKMELTPKRWLHVEGSMKCAYGLALKYGLETEKCVLAALLHDYFRDKNKEEIIELAKKYGVKLKKFDLKYPNVLHGKVAVNYFKEMKYKIPKEILKGIKHHTLGNDNFCEYGMLLFVVDAIEETRSYDGVECLRNYIATHSLKDGYKEVLRRTLSELIKKNKEIPLVTAKAYNKILEDN